MALSSNGNTKHSRGRGRHWCFTLNNYTEEDIENIKEDCKVGLYVFQREVGKEGTPHLQGFVSFKNPRTLIGLKRVNDRCHWEMARNINAAKDYCWKESTAAGEIFSNFDYEKKWHKNTTQKANGMIELSEIEKKIIIQRSVIETYFDNLDKDYEIFKYVDLCHPYLDKKIE